MCHIPRYFFRSVNALRLETSQSFLNFLLVRLQLGFESARFSSGVVRWRPVSVITLSSDRPSSGSGRSDLIPLYSYS